MSITKDKHETLLKNPSSASVIEEEDTIVVDEHRYIIKDSDIKVKAGSIKARFKHSLGMRCWSNLEWSRNGFNICWRVYL